MWSKHLILTMKQGNVEEFRRLLKNETEKNLNLIYENHCADFDENEVYRILYDAGATINGNFGVGLLHFAAAIRNIKFVKLLIEAGCDVNNGNRSMPTPLQIAVHSHSFLCYDDENRESESIVKFLLDHGANANTEDFWGCSPLYDAAAMESPTIARMLIAKGACVNKRNKIGNTPLHAATYYGSTLVVKLLLDNGADIHDTCVGGETPFTEAANRYDDSSYDIIKLLLEKIGKCDKTISYATQALPFALSNCDLRTIELLSDYGAHITEDIPRKNLGEHIGENLTALHYAATNRHVDVIKYVLDKNIDVNVRSTTKFTPLHVAVDYGCSDACKLLLSKGANVNFTNDRGHTPLYLAIKPTNFFESRYKIWSEREMMTRNILIAHIAKLVFSNILVNEMDIDVIEQAFETKRYYKSCVEELEKMKILKVYEDVSLFDILMKKDMASGYARNVDLIEALDSVENELNHDFPIYYSLLKEDFYEEIKKQKSIKKAAIFLNQIFNFNDPLHLVNLKILSHLREDDIIRINESKCMQFNYFFTICAKSGYFSPCRQK